VVSPRLGPAIEYGSPPLLLVPRKLDEGLPREQQFVFGALIARVAFSGIVADRRRLGALSEKQLDLLLRAAVEVTVPRGADEMESDPVYADLKRRLERALGPQHERVAKACSRVRNEGADIDSAWLFETMSRASLRAAILCACDPAVAVEWLRGNRSLFTEGAVSDPLPPTVMATLPFTVSAEHMRLRAHVMEGGS
jgi:hypothetical protein